MPDEHRVASVLQRFLDDHITESKACLNEHGRDISQLKSDMVEEVTERRNLCVRMDQHWQLALEKFKTVFRIAIIALSCQIVIGILLAIWYFHRVTTTGG